MRGVGMRYRPRVLAFRADDKYGIDDFPSPIA